VCMRRQVYTSWPSFRLISSTFLHSTHVAVTNDPIQLVGCHISDFVVDLAAVTDTGDSVRRGGHSERSR
jgi:hypothetical protein